MLKQFYGFLLSVIVHVAIFSIPFSFLIPQHTEKKDKELKLLAIVQNVSEEPKVKEENNECQCDNCDCNKHDINPQQPESQAAEILKNSEEKPVKPDENQVKPKKKQIKSKVRKKKAEPRKKLESKKKIQQQQKKITMPKKDIQLRKKEPESVKIMKRKESKLDKPFSDIKSSTENNRSFTSIAQEGVAEAKKTQEMEQKSSRHYPIGKSENKAKAVAKKSSVERKFGSREGPAFLHQSIPKYPRQAKRRGKEGAVILKLFIDEKGHLVKVQVVQDPGYGLGQAAVVAVKKSTFVPAKDRGQPVACRCLLPVKFVLR